MEIQRISEADCLASITQSLIKKKEGFRHTWIAYTGWGKSVANSILCEYVSQLGSLTIVVDQKNKDCIYPGTQIVQARQMSEAKGTQVIIRGPASTKKASDIVYFDDLAADVWTIGQSTDTPVCLMPDELTDAATNNQEWKAPLLERVNSKGKIERYRDPWMDKLYRLGRTLGISVAACTQLVQEVPRSALAMCETLGIFRQESRELAYLTRLGYLDKSLASIVGKLEVGEFLFVKRGEGARVCKFSYDGT